MSTINTSLSLIFSIAKAQSIMVKKFDGLSVYGLGFSDFIILYLLQNTEDGQMRRIDLAEKMGLTASGITRLLAPMEKRGWVERKAHERDARVSYVAVTRVGKETFDNALPTAERTANELLPSLTKKNFETIMRVLTDLGTL